MFNKVILYNLIEIVLGSIFIYFIVNIEIIKSLYVMAVQILVNLIYSCIIVKWDIKQENLYLEDK